MKKSIAIWHYPYRTPTENIYYFASHGFEALSQSGYFFNSSISTEERSAFTKAIRDTGVRFTVHHLLPCARKNYTAEAFTEHIKEFRRWQDETGLLWNLSFDVPTELRPHASCYIQTALDIFRGTDTKISVEDYGVTAEERADLEPLRKYENFGYLIDLGHMNIRLRNTDRVTPYPSANQQGEGMPLPPGDGSPEAFRNALNGKTFPIFEYHVHNNSGYDDDHRYMEDGTIDTKGLAKVLKDLDRDQVCTLELVPDWTGTPEEVARQREAERIYWEKLEETFRLPEFAGKPDPARDARMLRSVAFWDRCMAEE